MVRHSRSSFVIPAKAGIQFYADWIPAFAGMTDFRGNDGFSRQ